MIRTEQSARVRRRQVLRLGFLAAVSLAGAEIAASILPFLKVQKIVGLGVPSVLVGAGPQGLVLFWIVAILALASVVTVVQRFVYVYQVTEGATASGPPKGQS